MYVSDKFLSGSLIYELTFRIHWNNIEGATSPAWCEIPHQCIYKQCITGKFASRSPDHPGRHSGFPGWFIGRIWRPGDRICAALLNTGLFSTDWAKTTARRDEKHSSFGLWCGLYQRFGGSKGHVTEQSPRKTFWWFIVQTAESP